MYSKSITGPTTEPWGRPYFSVTEEEEYFPMFMENFHIVTEMPTWFTEQSKRTEWPTVSRTLWSTVYQHTRGWRKS